MTIQIDHGAFDRATTLVDEIAHDLRREHHQVQAQVGDLLSASWNGVASDQFGQAWQQCCRGMDDILSGISRQNALLLRVRSDLDDADDGSAAATRTLRSRLGETR